MPTIAHCVADTINRKPFLQEALSRGIVNFAALAEEMAPQISTVLRKPVKHAAVMMALRRHAEKFSAHTRSQELFDQNADLNVMSDIVEITLVRSPAVEIKLKQLHDLPHFQHGDLLTITQGMHEITVISNRKHQHAILKIFGKEEIRAVIMQLSEITLRLPVNATESVGLFAACTRALSWENIPIVEMVSTYTELMFIVREQDTAVTYAALRKLITDNRTTR